MGKELSFLLLPILATVLSLPAFPVTGKTLAPSYSGEYESSTYQYQQWLKTAGFSKALRASRAQKRDGVLYFYLDFNYEKVDSSLAAWSLLQRKFAKHNSHPMEAQLFYSACHVFKVPPHQLKLIIRNKDRDERFYFKLRFDPVSKSVVTDQPPLGFKAAGMVVDVGTVQNRSLIITTRADIKGKEAVYKAILNMARSHYEKKIEAVNARSTDEVAYFRYLPGNDDVLQFSVVGLRQEILRAEDNIWIAKMLNWISGTKDYDWRKVENIQFSINCKILSRRKMRIECDIEGRYGSGYYQTTEWQKCIPMAPDFGWYLQKYNDDFKNRIYELFSH